MGHTGCLNVTNLSSCNLRNTSLKPNIKHLFQWSATIYQESHMLKADVPSVPQKVTLLDTDNSNNDKRSTTNNPTADAKSI